MNLTDNFDKLGQAGNEGKELYNTRSNARVLSFILLDGVHYSVNYSYMIDGRYNPEDNMIVLQFTTSTVSLKGQNLLGMFEQIMAQMRKTVVCIESRYSATLVESAIAVFEIEVIQG